MKYTNELKDQGINEEGILFDLNSLYHHLEKVQDQRKRKGVRYSLTTILILILLAKLGGEDTPYGIADWVNYRKEQLIEMLNLKRKQLPHHTTYRRIMQKVIDAEELEEVVSEFHQKRVKEGEEIVISIDGKTMRGTISAEDTHGVHLLAAYAPEQGLVLMEMAVDRKENEIVVAPKVLKRLDLRGKIVVGDALHTQRNISGQIVEAGGDYIWIVKENQPRTRWAIEKLFMPEVCKPGIGKMSKDFKKAYIVNKGHGRIEKRTILTSSMLNDYLDWPYLAQVFRLERQVWYGNTGRSTRKVEYGITSLPLHKAPPARLLARQRDYWGIENGLHYRRDVTFKEDATRLTVDNAAQVMAVINNLVIGLLLYGGFENTAKARRLFCAQHMEGLKLVLSA